ncbi:GntR family transcriptional regulator [Kytococcus sp. Marseille-QA3725]
MSTRTLPTELPGGARGERPLPAGRRCARAIRELITVGELGPGEQLRESVLAQRLEVSRNTLREGFRELASQGLVEHQPNRGVFVTAPGRDAVQSLYTARRVLECGVLEDLARRESAVDVSAADGMLRLTAEARGRADAGEWARVGDLNMAFHAHIVSLAGSPFLDATAEPLLAHARLAFRSLDVPAGLHAAFVGQNQTLAGRLRGGQWARAAEELRGYLVRAEAQLLDGLGRGGPDAT